MHLQSSQTHTLMMAPKQLIQLLRGPSLLLSSPHKPHPAQQHTIASAQVVKACRQGLLSTSTSLEGAHARALSSHVQA